MTAPGGDTGAEDRLGSAAQEAARLFEAVQEWARRTSSGANEHVASGSAECRICPVCQVIALLRTTRPEVFEHLAAALGSLGAALAASVDGHEHEWASRRSAPVEYIDVR